MYEKNLQEYTVNLTVVSSLFLFEISTEIGSLVSHDNAWLNGNSSYIEVL